MATTKEMRATKEDMETGLDAVVRYVDTLTTGMDWILPISPRQISQIFCDVAWTADLPGASDLKGPKAVGGYSTRSCPAAALGHGRSGEA